MSDIVRRLRVETDRICSEAADKIEQLQADLAASERLREHANRELAKDSTLVERLRAAHEAIADLAGSFSRCAGRRRCDSPPRAGGEMTDYKNFPLDECVRAVMHILETSPPGTAIFQKWTCSGCGARVTGDNPNMLVELGVHEECGHTTNIRETGCNYSVRMAIGGIASVPPKGGA